MNEIGYSGIHTKLARIRGTARSFPCRCGSNADEWAYDYTTGSSFERVSGKAGSIGMKFSIDIMDYIPLCKSCHEIFDKRDTRDECPAGHEYTEDNIIIDNSRRKCKTCVYARNNERRKNNPMTPAQKERKLELQRLRRANARASA